MMHRILASLFFEEPTTPPETIVPKIKIRNEEELEAFRDLRDTYAQPIKCLYQTTPRKFTGKRNSISILKHRETGQMNFRRYPQARYQLMDRLLPEEHEVVASMSRPTFCGQFSDDGQRFVSACQDFCIRLYDTPSSRTFTQLAEIEVEEVGWSILDTALSPNRTSVAYSTWSDCIYLVRLNEDQGESTVVPLNLQPFTNRFGIFSLQYSVNGSEIICGSNDACVYIYDLEKHKRTLRVEAHNNDVNAVRFIDDSNSLIVSGSDDGFVLVWDRRGLRESYPKPVGVFAGHTSGITFIDSRRDTRYLISNGKDQCIKLWDMRRFADDATIQACRLASNTTNRSWDYRAGAQPHSLHNDDIPGDPSVQTYSGHSVGFTLIRCYFSPAFNTGQRYIVTGSSDGCVYIYDVLTGEIKRHLRIQNNQYGTGRDKCIRDVSWHPFENYIVSTSWDNRRAHVRWTHRTSVDSEPSLSPPVETKATATEALSSLRSPDQLARFRRLLMQQLLGTDDNSNDEDESISD